MSVTPMEFNTISCNGLMALLITRFTLRFTNKAVVMMFAPWSSPMATTAASTSFKGKVLTACGSLLSMYTA